MHGVLGRLGPAAAAAGTLVATFAVTAPADASTTAPTATTASTAPAGFRAQSTSWLDRRDGFLLGSAPCGSATCTDVLGTTDAGRSWQLLGHPHAPIARDGHRHPGVGEVRFTDASHGWAFAPLLRHTSDGGATWTTESIPGDGGSVVGLATDSDGTWAVVSPCAWAHSGGCRRQPLTLWHTSTPTGTTWTQADVSMPYGFGAGVSVSGSTVFVWDPQLDFGGDDVLLVSSDGSTFATRQAPCDHSQDLALVQVVATSAQGAALLCDGDPGFSKAVKSVYTTDDSAKTYTYRGTMGLEGIQAELAVSPSGNLAVASSSDGSFIYINDGGRRAWRMPVGIGDGGLGWNDIGYVAGRVAYVVYSPVGSFGGQGRLWVTHDGGRDWTDVSP